MPVPQVIEDLQAAVDAVLDQVPGDIVMGIPLAVGKPNPFVNALNLRGPGLPPNIAVREFFMKTGDYLHNHSAQQNYISTNYTFVARDMLLQGMNVIAQAVASQGKGDDWRLSVSSNPDVVFEVAEKFAAQGLPLLKVGVVNRKMPFMPNGAAVAPGFFDIVVTDPAATHQPFGPPNGKVSTADYAIGLHASSLVVDGGTLQIGIGSLGDAISQSLIVRDRHAVEYHTMLQSLCPDGLAGRELGRFDRDVRQRLSEVDRGRHHSP